MMTINAILVCFAVSRMFTQFDGPANVFLEFRLLLGRNAYWQVGPLRIGHFLAELFRCPYCLGFWISLALGWYLFPDNFLFSALAIYGGQIFLQVLTNEEPLDELADDQIVN